MLEQIGVNALAALTFGVVTTLLGLFATWASRFIRRRRAHAETEIETIAATVRDERQAATDPARIEALLKQELGRPKADLSEAVRTLTALIHEISDEKSRSPAIEALISGYHEQALTQSSTQFWFSVAAATTGFAWILYTGLDIRPDNIATVLKTVPGVIMDAVAFLFFKQAAETRQRATDLYDRLRRDKQTSDSIVLVASIEDVRVRSAVKAQMALHMAGLEPSPINLTQFLSGGDAQPPAGQVLPSESPPLAMDSASRPSKRS